MPQLCLVRNVPPREEITPGDMVQTVKGRFLVCTVNPTDGGTVYLCVNKATGEDARVLEKDIVVHDPASTEGRQAFAFVWGVADRLIGFGDISV